MLAIHTITTKPWTTEECIDHYAAAGVGGITFWRYNLEGRSPEHVGRQAREAGLEVVSLARGGFFPASSLEGRQEAIDENRRAIDEAASLGAPSLVLVCGAVPGQPLSESRTQITDGIAACLDHASSCGVVLAIEPLHPMYAGDRSAINTMAQANDVCASLKNHPHVGIACDVYHTWWDPDLESEITRAAENHNLTSYHICDWKVPTEDLLNDREIMGRGCAPLDEIDRWIQGAGFSGAHEVEIFSNHHWARDQHTVLSEIVTAYNQMNGGEETQNL